MKVEWLTPPQQDGEVQAQRVRQALNEGVDGILISCSDAGKVTGAINDAVDRGVPVMTFDSDAPQSKRFAFYGVDDEKTGQQTMAELAKLMNGKGNVAILAGNQNAPNLQRRVQGAKAEAAKYPGIKIVGVFNHIETPQDASAEVVRVNNAYPEITGWAFIGGWPLSTQSLLTDINPAKMKVASVDALPSQLVVRREGNRAGAARAVGLPVGRHRRHDALREGARQQAAGEPDHADGARARDEGRTSATGRAS